MIVARAAALAVVVACGGAPTAPGAPTRAQPATLDDVAWLAGTWHAAALDAHWQRVGDALWGVAFDRQHGFEVNLVRAGAPALSLLSIENGRDARAFALVSATPQRLAFADASQRSVTVVRTAHGWRGEFVAEPGHPPLAFDAEPGQLDAAPAPELEALDREFAASSAARGGDAWPPYFADDGAEWSDGRRIEHAQIGDTMRRVLLGATMAWQPVASGRRGDLGFTLGSYELVSKASGARERGSYCSIWRADADGRWKIVFDVGSKTPR